MGEVWKAHDDNLDRDVAIKMLLHGTLGDATTRERFRREALVLSRLSHPGVATIFDFDVRNGFEFLVMEYVAGGTLESRIAAGLLPVGTGSSTAISSRETSHSRRTAIRKSSISESRCCSMMAEPPAE